jgi:hypothetical protein
MAFNPVAATNSIEDGPTIIVIPATLEVRIGEIVFYISFGQVRQGSSYFSHSFTNPL